LNIRLPVLLMRSVALLFLFYAIEKGVCWVVILLGRWLRSP
jgi:hypothetical protein